MRISVDPFSFVVVAVAGWMSRHQQEVISYLIEENRILREQMGSRPSQVQRRPTTAIGGESQKAWAEDAGSSGDHRRAGNSVDVAPKSDWPKARWQ